MPTVPHRLRAIQKHRGSPGGRESRNPEAFALEGIGWQRQPLSLTRALLPHAAPIHVAATHKQLAQAGEHLLPVALPRAQAGQEHRALVCDFRAVGANGETVLGHAQQCRFRANLHIDGSPLRRQSLHAFGKAHSCPQMLPPIGRRCDPLAFHRAGDIGDKGNPRAGKGDLARRLLKWVEDAFHQRRVGGAGDLEARRFDFRACAQGRVLARAGQRGEYLLDGRGIAGDDHIPPAVDDTDRHAVCPGRDGAADGFVQRLVQHLLRGLERDHGPRRSTPHQPPAGCDQVQPVFKAEHAGHARRGIFARAVAHHDIRADAPGFPELG